ncbi:MAG: hypothetical protein NTY79_03215 [Chloroflexi bacterium]|nr:hypothetical protein [Chloroflexota bacterium]
MGTVRKTRTMIAVAATTGTMYCFIHLLSFTPFIFSLLVTGFIPVK